MFAPEELKEFSNPILNYGRFVMSRPIGVGTFSFLAILAIGLGALEVFHPSHSFIPATSADIERKGGGSGTNRVDFTLDPNYCQKQMGYCGGHCCVCTDTTVVSVGVISPKGRLFATTSNMDCKGFNIFENENCTGSSEARDGNCSITWVNYVDP